jgi:phosphatidylglycerophosphate synthase
MTPPICDAPRRCSGTVASPSTLYIDARAGGAVTAFTPVAGVPLVARHVRQAARAGRRAVTVLVAEEADRALAEQALAWRPAPGVALTLEVGAPPPGADVVAARSVVGPDGVIAAEVTSPAEVTAAEAALYAALRKNVELDGFVAYHVMRPLARGLTRALVGTRVTPNQVTAAALVLGLLAAAVATRGAFALAGLLFWAGAVVDCVDGELARLRVEGSRTGEWLDSLADEAATFALGAGVGVGLGGPWPLLAGIGVANGLLTAAKLYSDLARLGLPIDTARYPWFFARSDGSPSPAPPRLARAVRACSYLFKRDAYATIVAICLLAGAGRVAFLLLFGGIAVITVLLLVHLVVSHEAPHSSS